MHGNMNVKFVWYYYRKISGNKDGLVRENIYAIKRFIFIKMSKTFIV